MSPKRSSCASASAFVWLASRCCCAAVAVCCATLTVSRARGAGTSSSLSLPFAICLPGYAQRSRSGRSLSASDVSYRAHRPCRRCALCFLRAPLRRPVSSWLSSHPRVDRAGAPRRHAHWRSAGSASRGPSSLRPSLEWSRRFVRAARQTPPNAALPGRPSWRLTRWTLLSHGLGVLFRCHALSCGVPFCGVQSPHECTPRAGPGVVAFRTPLRDTARSLFRVTWSASAVSSRPSPPTKRSSTTPLRPGAGGRIRDPGGDCRGCGSRAAGHAVGGRRSSRAVHADAPGL